MALITGSSPSDYELEEGTETTGNERCLCTVGIWHYPCAI